MISAGRLKQARLHARLTQQELAGRARLSVGSVGTVSNLETGRIADPRFSTLRRLARALRIKEEELEIGC